MLLKQRQNFMNTIHTYLHTTFFHLYAVKIVIALVQTFFQVSITPILMRSKKKYQQQFHNLKKKPTNLGGGD